MLISTSMCCVDEESSNSAALQPGAKKSAVPKRLLIGNDEYVELCLWSTPNAQNTAIIDPEHCALNRMI